MTIREVLFVIRDAFVAFFLKHTAMDKLFGSAKKKGNSIKFGGGFYCAKIDTPKPAGGFLSGIFGKLFG